MSRPPRVVIPGLPHHLTQRGNRGQDVFYTPGDRQQYLVWLAESAQRYGLKVWAYCLMTNHVHLIVVPETPEAVAHALRDLHKRHAQRLNAERGWQGHLWQARYYSCVLDEAHLWEAVRYVERNPVRAGLVPAAEAYPWSSAAVHCGLRTDPVVSPDLPLVAAIDDWQTWLTSPEDETALASLRRATAKGLPCGDSSFLELIESRVGIPLRDRHRGRPPKSEAKMCQTHFPDVGKSV